MFEKFFRLLAALATLPVFLVIQRSLFIVLPLILVGAFSLSIRHFPSPPFIAFLDRLFGPEWQFFLDDMIAGTSGIISLAVLCTFSASMAMVINQKRKGPFVSPIMATVVVMSCFFVLCFPSANNSWEQVFSMGRGLLPAFCIAVVSCTLFLFLSRLRWLHWSMGAVGHDPVVRDILTVLPAGMITILLAALIRVLFNRLGIPDLHSATCNFLFLPFSNVTDSLSFALSYTGLSQLFWVFGAHGPNLLFGVEEHILVPAVHANQLALSRGLTPDIIFTKPFFDLYTRMGGSGSTICLILAILFKSRDRGARKLCLFALIPALCNVNEPLLFGVPLVLNPVYVVPFILTPMIQAITAYVATVTGVLPCAADTVAWTTPVFVSGFFTTGSMAGPMVQAVNVIIGVACYTPFVILADKLRESQAENLLTKLKAVAGSSEFKAKGIGILDIPGEAGRFAKTLADDLKLALYREKQLYLVYQPQVSDSGGFISGVEALLRWDHPVYGRISPEITVSIAQEIKQMDRLGLFVLSRACRQRAAWKGIVNDTFTMSVNVVPGQLTDPLFAQKVFGILDEHHLTTAMLELEITESSVLEPDENTLNALEHLHENGIRIAIDDFGMGHASLRYLRSFPVSTIKIDRSLTFGDEREINSQIVKSVFDLSRTLDISTIVEGVETREQLNRFMDIGYATFQGYFFSRPLAGRDCTAFIRGYKPSGTSGPALPG